MAHIHGRRTSCLELLNELRHGGHGGAHDAHDVRRAIQRLVDDAVEQAFDRPGEFADELRADHAAAALQRVEGTTHIDQRIHVLRVLIPHGEEFLEPADFVLRFLDEQLEEFRIDLPIDRLDHRRRDRCGRRRCCCGRRGRGLRHESRRAIENRRAFLLGGRCNGLRQRFDDDGARVIRCLREAFADRHGLGLRQIAQAGLGIVEHVPGIGAAGLDRFHVVLDGDDAVGKPIDGFGRQRHAIGTHELRQRLVDTFHDLGGARLAEHQQARGDAAHQRRNLIDALAFARAVHRLRNRFLDACHVDDAFAQHRFGDLTEFDVVGAGGLRRCAAGFGSRHDHADELFVETVFDLDERCRHAQQHVFADRRLLRDDRLQIRGLALHLVAQVAETQYAERIADLLQQFELRREFFDLRAAAADEQVERILHAAEVFLDRGGDRLHQLDRRRRQALARLFDLVIDRQQLAQTE